MTHDPWAASVSCAEVDALLGLEDVHANPTAARLHEIGDHVTRCARCAERWAGEMAVIASIGEEPAPIVAPPLRPARPTPSWRRVAGLVAASIVAGVLVVRPWCVATDGPREDVVRVQVEAPAPPPRAATTRTGQPHPVAVREQIIVERALPGGRIAREVQEVVRMEIRR